MKTKWLGRTTVRLDVVQSTNETAKQYADQGAEDGTLIVANRQTAGKGRRGRRWEDGGEDSLLMSVLLRPAVTVQQSASLTLVAALAVCRGLESMRRASGTERSGSPQSSGERFIKQEEMPWIKWPNDIVIDSRKVCGILTELIFCKDGGYYVVLGIGINVNNPAFSEELEETATSLSRQWHDQIDKEQLMERVWQEFESCYEMFCRTKDLSLLREAYEERLINRGRRCRLLNNGTEILGEALGIDERGHLLICGADGERIEVDAGEVSVRGICGYV